MDISYKLKEENNPLNYDKKQKLIPENNTIIYKKSLPLLLEGSMNKSFVCNKCGQIIVWCMCNN